MLLKTSMLLNNLTASYSSFYSFLFKWLFLWTVFVLFCRWRSTSRSGLFSIHASAIFVSISLSQPMSALPLRLHRALLRRFYSLGALAATFTLFPAVVMLAWNLSGNIYPYEDSTMSPAAPDPRQSSLQSSRPPWQAGHASLAAGQRRRALIRPLIPGFTVPLSHFGAIAAAAAAALLVHEAGHAAAAVAEGVRCVGRARRDADLA